MIHSSTQFCCTSLTLYCHSSYTSFVLETSILLPPSILFQNISTSPFSSSTGLSRHGPNAEIQDIITVTSSHSKVHSLKAAIFHTMAYKLSLEINNNKITPKSLIAFLKVLYNVTQIKKKHITFEQYSRLHVAGPKIAICETASNVVFVLNSAFTSKDQYFQAALHEATNAFNEMLHSFGYTQKLEHYDPHQHQAHPPQQHPLYN